MTSPNDARSPGRAPPKSWKEQTAHKFNTTYNELRNTFIAPLSNWGFKKLFGTNENKENLELAEDEKNVIYDIACLKEY